MFAGDALCCHAFAIGTGSIGPVSNRFCAFDAVCAAVVQIVRFTAVAVDMLVLVACYLIRLAFARNARFICFACVKMLACCVCAAEFLRCRRIDAGIVAFDLSVDRADDGIAFGLAFARNTRFVCVTGIKRRACFVRAAVIVGCLGINAAAVTPHLGGIFAKICVADWLAFSGGTALIFVAFVVIGAGTVRTTEIVGCFGINAAAVAPHLRRIFTKICVASWLAFSGSTALIFVAFVVILAGTVRAAEIVGRFGIHADPVAPHLAVGRTKIRLFTRHAATAHAFAVRTATRIIRAYDVRAAVFARCLRVNTCAIAFDLSGSRAGVRRIYAESIRAGFTCVAHNIARARMVCAAVFVGCHWINAAVAAFHKRIDARKRTWRFRPLFFLITAYNQQSANKQGTT